MGLEEIRKGKEEAKNRKPAYGLRRIGLKRQEKIKEFDELQDKDDEFLRGLWDALKPEERICYETGEPLGGKYLKIFAHHVLEKKDYPQFRYEPWNIRWVSRKTHRNVHDDIDRCPKLKALTAQLINQWVT
ncbi:MAG: hypothetical protein C5B59_08050 [Bacteroidetes bacterium]|nr:MAG: hypothetical protein C5B59_08050 [Bacteroidota bacterium]